MHRSKTLAVLPFFIVLFLPCISHSARLEEEVQSADQAFNRGDTVQALSVYQRAQQVLAARDPSSPLLSEVINNIAAVHMAEGNIAEFNKYFALARGVKQKIAGKTPVQSRTNQMLINGGFEDGLVSPWGSGHYERMDGNFHFGLWWNSMNARAFMKIDRAEKHSGQQSLRITNYSPAAPHVFTTLSQRIGGLKPGTIYRVSFYAKAKDLTPGAASFAVDAAWVKRLPGLPAGTYDWQPFASTLNIGHNDYIDFRVLLVNTGTLWLDDIVVRKMESSEEPDLMQRVESLIDLAEYEEALKLCLDLEKQNRESKETLRTIRFHMGRIYQVLGEYDRAFEAFNWAIANGLWRGNIDLARLYYQLGDYETARDHFLKSFDLVKDDQGTASLVLHELSRCYLAMAQPNEALTIQIRAHRILKHIEDRYGQALSMNQLGEIYQRLSDLERAQQEFIKALQLARQLGDRRLEADILINLADVAWLNRNLDVSSRYVEEGLKIKEAIHDQLGLVKAMHIRGRLSVARSRLEEAREYYVRAISLLEDISANAGDISRETRFTFMQQFNRLYREYVDLLFDLYHKNRDANYQDEAFQVTEQARSRVFTEMIEESQARRAFAAGSPQKFGDLMEQERMLTFEVLALNKELQKARDSGDAAGIQRFKERLAKGEGERRAVRAQLEKEYPSYADLKNPKPLAVSDLQKLLAADEAVLSYFVAPGRTGLWAITREKVEFLVLPLTREVIIQKCEHYRRGFEEIAKIISETGQTFDRLRAAFSRYRGEEAHELYRILVLPAEPLISNKKYVFLALDDLLYKLPFETFLTRPLPNERESRGILGESLIEAPFWVKTHHISYLPSLSVIRSLRTFVKGENSNPFPLLAFADPDFSSKVGSGRSSTPGKTRAALLRKIRGVLTVSDVTPPPLPDTRDVTFPPLPDTREEALHAARVLGASVERDVYLQARATEFNLKHLPLDRYRNLLFATHGVLAGSFGPGTQPALVLSVVNDPENDGLLEMGEILGLNLNANLAVLSACNTASGGSEEDRGEGFAGLTRSFMYAGARSLLVTQWSVESSSARMLVEANFSKIKEGYPKAHALALAKRTLIESDTPIDFHSSVRVSLAHPFFWAPYILVGEVR